MIKRNKWIILFSTLMMTSASVKAEEVKFFKKYGTHQVDVSEQIKQTAGGDLLILSSIRRPNSLGQIIRDLYLVKTDLNGDTIWTKYAGRDERSELGRDFEIMANGNILITGFSIYNMGHTVRGFLMCFDEAGELLWEKYYGDDVNIWAFTSLKVAEDGILMAGTFENGMTGDTDALVLKTSLTGDSLWSTTVGGAEYDDAWDIELAPDGGSVFTGGTYSFAEGALDDAWIVKLDALGTFQWRKTYGTADKIDWAWAFVPSHDSDGNIDGYVFTGIKNAGEEGTAESLFGDFHFVKVDTAGETIWDKSIIAPPGTMRREGTDIIATSDGGYAMCGYGIYANPATGLPSNGLYFVKTDVNGDIEYAFQAADITDLTLPRALTEASNGDFYITGMAAPGMSSDMRIFLARIGSDSATNTQNPDLLKDRIDVYPNPAADHITIRQHQGADLHSVNIFAIDGSLLQTLQVKSGSDIVIPLSQYSGTSILLGIHNKNGESTYRKIVVL